MAVITVSPGNSAHEIFGFGRSNQMPNVSLTNSSFPLVLYGTAINHALTGLAMVFVFIIMFSGGCKMEISKIKVHILKPKGVVMAAVSQFGIMPLTAFALSKIFRLAPMEALTVFICGCCPGGTLSNILTLASKGDMNLSIVMTGCSSLLALGMMPLLLYLYTKGSYDNNLEGKVPFKDIVLSLFMTLIACALGIILNEKKPKYARLLNKVGVLLMLLLTIPITVLSVISLGDNIFLVILSPRLVGTSVLLPFFGFSLGYILSAYFNFNELCKRTICLETGCQNVTLCLAILRIAFPADVIGPLFFFPGLYLIFQVGEGLLLVVIFRNRGNTKEPNGKNHFPPSFYMASSLDLQFG
nr:PREDICTED: sodium/bile acid cotransporter [Anolis carolinensis]|eukprot:XP_016851911.1 PREDICTED: sodium/bile acid cotransporter [Anolis carolinensis]